VDGKRKVEELVRLAQALGDAEPTLQFLADQGFVEDVSGNEPAQPGPAGVSNFDAPAEPAQEKRVPLAEAQRFAVRRLTDILGPTAESLCLRIEAARNRQDFESAVARAQNMVRDIRGGSVADRFTAELQGHWPA
jgi:hypothetical protein